MGMESEGDGIPGNGEKGEVFPEFVEIQTGGAVY